MKNNKTYLVYLAVFALGTAASSCSSPAGKSNDDLDIQAGFDPVSMDPQVNDSKYAPTFEGGSFEIEGSLVNALWWQPEGKGPNPTILLLHGFMDAGGTDIAVIFEYR